MKITDTAKKMLGEVLSENPGKILRVTINGFG